MRAELANINHCAVPFLSRAAVNLSWYDSTYIIIIYIIYMVYAACTECSVWNTGKLTKSIIYHCPFTKTTYSTVVPALVGGSAA